ncbi:MAG: response regulator [Acidobacteria bacterium]|nr:response regulator [Acidobacteriota bacterium]
MGVPRVLLVDDEPSLRWTMSEFLKREGYEVLAAADFESALSLLGETSVDAAVVDIILPGRSGVDLLKELRSRESYIPVVMITGEPNPSQIPEIVRSGAYDFIAKPVLKEVLVKAVSRAVEKKRLIDEKQRLEEEIKRHAEEMELRVAERTAELAGAHGFLNLVLDSSTEYAIVATDVKGYITLFNRGAEQMFGYTAAAALGKRPGVLLGQQDDERLNQVFLTSVQEADASGQSQSEARFRRAGGEELVASVAVTPIRNDGGVIGYLGVIKDLTAEREGAELLRRMQERLAHQEKIAALGQVAAQVAHEVKNPLAGILLYTMHLRSKVADKLCDAELGLIDKVVETINHLSSSVEQILAYARPIHLVPRPTDLNRIITDVIQLLRSQIAASRVEQQLELEEASGCALLDEASIRSALLNLILNAVQSMPNGGTLCVRTRATAAETLRLEITDTGSGMTEEQVNNIFEPFYTTKRQGLGLGMPYAKRVLEQHHGSVSVESRPGEGTTVWVELPRGVEEN